MAEEFEQNNIAPRNSAYLEPIEEPNSYPTKPTVGIADAIQQTPQAEQKTENIRTFQSDISGAVKSDNISMIKIALAEKGRREQEGQYVEVSAKKISKTPFIVIGVVVLLVGLGVGFVYLYFNQAPLPTIEQTIAPKEPEIIYSETQAVVNTDGKAPAVLLGEIKAEGLAPFDLGTVKRTLLTTGVGTSTRNITSDELFAILKTRIPAQLQRSINPYFVVGTYAFTPHDSFMILKINSYDNAYAGMLAWEPYMETDIGGMFIGETRTQPITPIEGVNPIVNTTQSREAVFKDKVVQNKDARVLTAEDGSIKFMYTFIDKETLVLVSSENGLKEILFRLTSGRIIR